MGDASKVLIVDGDPQERRNLHEQLSLHGQFHALLAATGEEALGLARRDYFDAMLLRVSLPDMDGRELCRLMRRAGVGAPIILLGEDEGAADVILGLDAGANDYVTKPYGIGVLVARLRAHLRAHEMGQDPVFPIRHLRFRPNRKQLINPGSNRPIHLTSKETAILKILLQAGNRLVTWDGLLREVRRHSARASVRSLRAHADALRRKIADDPAAADMLIVDSGGLRLVR